MRINYVKRTSKKNRQELLDKALAEELEYLRKKCFPWQRTKFLYFKVEIKEQIFDEYTILGRYTKVKNENNSYKYTHLIEIKKWMIYNCQKIPMNYYRKKHYEQLREVIRHELIHCFVEERYENMFSMKNANYDASPVFLTVLRWVAGDSGHECAYKFKKTTEYKEIHKFENFKELDNHIFMMLLKYKEAIRDIEKISNAEDVAAGKTKTFKSVQNEFQFASRDVGFQKLSQVNQIDVIKNIEGIYIKTDITCRTWEIGCNVTPDQVKELYNKKVDSKAKYYKYKKALNVYDESCANKVKTIIIEQRANI